MLDSGGGKKGGGGGGGGGGGETTGDGGDGDGGDDGGVDLSGEPLYDWALASCAFLEECCTADCDGPYGWGEEIATMDDCVGFALALGVVVVDGEVVPACPGPDYDALVECIEGLVCGESVTFDCPDFEADFVACD